jgi:hypothetical protein
MIIRPEEVAVDMQYASFYISKLLGAEGVTPRQLADQWADPELTVKVLIWALLKTRGEGPTASFGAWCAEQALVKPFDDEKSRDAMDAADHAALAAAGKRLDLVLEFTCEAATEAADSFEMPTQERVKQIEHLVELIGDA